VPGTKDYEEPAYWRDVGTLESYFEATQDVLGLQPRFDVFNPRWPIYSKTYQGPVAKIVSGQIDDSILAGGTLVNNARVRNCILRHEVILDDDVELEDCIIMDYTRIGRGARLRRTIVDRFNVIKPGTRIGFDPEEDKKRYHVSPGGIVVVSRGHQRRSGRGSYAHGDA
jgi:glucose-1-phosphate adenylyltransferase